MAYSRTKRIAFPRAAAVLAFATLNCMAHAQDTNIAMKMIAVERDYSDAMSNLEYLSDMIGPRLTGSENLKKASEWTAQRMRDYGLDNVHLEAYTIPEGWERGSVEMEITSPSSIHLIAAQMAWTPGTHGAISAPVVLFAPRTEAELDEYHGKLHGAIVLRVAGNRGPRPNGMMGYAESKAPPPIPALAKPAPVAAPDGAPNFGAMSDADRQKFVALQRKTADFLKSEGVAAVIQDAGKPYDLLNMTGSWTSIGAYPTLFMAHEHVALLQRLIARNVPVTVSLNVKSRFVRGPITVYNTVGEIKGASSPDQVVVLGGHLDSWDLGTGTTDNGTGTTATLEAAHILKAVNAQPARTIRFILFTGEEEGLMGSQAYVKAHMPEMPQIDVVFIDDTGTGRVKGAWLQNRDNDKPMLAAQFDELKQLGLMTDDVNLIPGKMNGTDHASFDDAGVPAFAFNQDSADYGLTHHSQLDTFGMVREDDLKQGALTMAIFAYNAATAPALYPRSGSGTAR